MIPGGRRGRFHRTADTASCHTEGVALFFLLCLVIGAIIASVFLIAQYVRRSSIEQRGWFWNDKPDLRITTGLNLPPFGIGMNRKVKQQVMGRSRSGIPFQAFRYRSDFWDWEQQVVCMPLPHSMPPFHLFHESAPIPGVQGLIMDVWGPVKAVFQDEAHGRAVAGVLAPLIPSLGYNRLTIDHDQLVLLDVNRDVETLQLAVEWLTTAHAAITGSPAINHEREPPLPYVSFANHPDWEFVDRDDSLLDMLPLSTRGGQVFNIVRCLRGPISFIRVTHQWQTAVYNGKTVNVQNHIEHFCGFWVDFSFIPISVNMAGSGDVQRFESIEFNERFTVYCRSPRFASDVFNPRQLEFFLGFPEASFSIDQNGVITARDREWPLERVEMMLFLLHGFFARIPDFVWRELGVWPRPVPEVDAPPVGG